MTPTRSGMPYSWSERWAFLGYGSFRLLLGWPNNSDGCRSGLTEPVANRSGGDSRLEGSNPSPSASRHSRATREGGGIASESRPHAERRAKDSEVATDAPPSSRMIAARDCIYSARGHLVEATRAKQKRRNALVDHAAFCLWLAAQELRKVRSS